MQELDSVLISLLISLFVTMIEQSSTIIFCYAFSLLKKTFIAEFNKNFLIQFFWNVDKYIQN